MLSASFIALLSLIALTQGDPREMVSKLNSPRSAERAEAEARLEALGDAAIPALVEATDSTNLELRHRAAAFLDKIEGRRLSQPTLIALDFQSRPLREVADVIGHSAGCTIVIEPEADARVRDKLITLKSEQPLPLWTAIDRLCIAAGLRLDPPMSPWMRQRQGGFGGGNLPFGRARAWNGTELIFRPDESSLAVPISQSGAFRVSVASLILDRNRNFVRSSENQGIPETVTQFTVSLQLRGEPRLTIASIDESHLIEAVDDRGQSLLVPAIMAPVAPRAPNRGMGEMVANPPLVFALKYPDVPGRLISRFRGSIRGLVVGRRGEPLVIPLEKPDGKTFTSGSVAVTVQSFRQGGPGRETSFDFSIEGGGGGHPAQPMFSPNDPRAGLRPPASASGQIEFVDAKGRVCHLVDLGGFNGAFGAGNERKIVFMSPQGFGPPVEARYHPAVWSTVEIPFDFRDIPMP